ncbi:methyltransferase [Lentzea sp. NPDC058436]|uniref:methyltransferase n=1 Tax=Lentzea sp. NPDC058436 TaxID=3346499 RepID=UPI00365C30D2
MGDHDVAITPESSTVYLFAEAMGYLRTACLRAVAQLGVADHLGDEPRPVEELAEATGTDPDFLRRVLRLLATRNIFRQEQDGRFSLLPLGQGLRTDSRSSARWGVVMSAMNTHWNSAFGLVEGMRTGKPAFDELYGTPFFDHITSDREAGAEFHRGMDSFSGAARRLALEAYDFPSTGTVVDVGGGHGGFLRDVLLRHPGLNGVLLDQAHVLPGASPEDVDPQRWTEIAGDFFVDVPEGGDVYVLSYVLHDWSDDECVRLLRNCRESMAPGARIAVFDAIVEPGNEPDDAKLLDLVMMMLVPGRERTAEEVADLLRQADLKLDRVVATEGPLSVVEATAA